MAHSSAEVGKAIIHFLRTAVTFAVMAPFLEPEDSSMTALTSLNNGTLALCKQFTSSNGKAKEVKKLYSESPEGDSTSEIGTGHAA